MRKYFTLAGVALAVVAGLSLPGLGAEGYGLAEGNADLKSAGALAFGPEGILFVGDAKGATVYAIDTGDTKGDASKVQVNVSGINAKIAELLGVAVGEIQINDLAVNPRSGNIYLSITKGGSDAKPAIVRVDASGKLSSLPLDKARFSKAALPNAAEDKTVAGPGGRQVNRRMESITDLAYVDGKVLVAGLTAAAAPSNVRSLLFPFTAADDGTTIEIFHGAHGRLEDYAAVRAFVPFTINGEPSVLAGFTCTPLVKFPLNSLTPGKKVRGTTVAELGNRNKPIAMIAYKKDGKDYLLMANTARGLMKISTNDLARDEGITQPVTGGGTAGQSYETIKELPGIVQLDKLNDTSAVVVIAQAQGGPQDLKTIPLP
jgi:hypothetical protein